MSLLLSANVDYDGTSRQLLDMFLSQTACAFHKTIESYDELYMRGTFMFIHCDVRLGYTWNTKVRDIMRDTGTDFYFHDPLRTNLTTMRDLASHSNGIYPNFFILMQNITRTEQASRVRYYFCLSGLVTITYR